MGRIILHCDMDRFYATIEEKYNPALHHVPFAVCGDPELRHSIVMSANGLAKKFGVRAGLSYSDARQLCPNLAYVRADLEKYLAEAKTARAIYRKYAAEIVPYGLDEAWLLPGGDLSWHEAGQIAELIRLEVKYAMGLSVSVGVSDNLIFSKIGSDYNKPDGITVVTKENYKELIWPLDAAELLFVGTVRRRTLTYGGIQTIGDIAAADPERLAKMLKSKVGYDLWRFANGDDRSFKPANDSIGSMGNTITPPADLRTNDDVSAVIYMLVTAVCARLRKHELKTKCVSLYLRDNQFNRASRQCTLPHATDKRNYLFNRAYTLFKTQYTMKHPLRSIGVRVGGIDDSGQTSLFDDEDCDMMLDIDRRIQKLTTKFGSLRVEKTSAIGRW